jgi:glutamine amidotransferase
MIAIIDYKMGNVKSMMNAIGFLGCKPCLTNNAEEILDAEKIILPGVGAFDMAMHNLKNIGLIDILNQAVFEKQIPILGVCLGMHIFASRGEENEPAEGLGWISGEVKRFSFNTGSLRIPHIGFNSIHSIKRRPNLFEGLRYHDFYFVHGYHLICEDQTDVSSWCHYGYDFAASIQKGNIFGAQFHPEKSQSNGIIFLKNFLQL